MWQNRVATFHAAAKGKRKNEWEARNDGHNPQPDQINMLGRRTHSTTIFCLRKLDTASWIFFLQKPSRDWVMFIQPAATVARRSIPPSPPPPDHVMFYKLAQPQDSAPNLLANHCRLGHLALGACRWTLTDNRLPGSHWTEDLAGSTLNTEKEKRLLLQVHNGELEKQRTSCVHSTTPAKQFSLCLLLAVVRYCLPSPDMGVGWCPQS